MSVQGNFFQNIGSITLFAVIGTAISAFIVGGGIYFLGQVRIVVVAAAAAQTLLLPMFTCVVGDSHYCIATIICLFLNGKKLSVSSFVKADVIYKMTMTDR